MKTPRESEVQGHEVYGSLKPMISYAQQGEDVVLRRALADVSNGFYVDVGAAHPVIDSVTNHFYNHGWRGINIEPQSALYEQLCAKRPEDNNIKAVIGQRAGSAVLRVYNNAPGWASIDESTTRLPTHQAKSHDIVVPRIPLDDVLEQYATGRHINFIKIDAEGSETDVLKSVDLRRWLPDVLVVEATIPGSATPSFDYWEPTVLESGYSLALFDGLNRFYTHIPRLQALMGVPANVFDNYKQHQYIRNPKYVLEFAMHRLRALRR